MTCIIGVKHENRIYMGSDSAITLHHGLIAATDTKIHKYFNCLVGFSGPKSVPNLIDEEFKIFEGKFDSAHLNKIWRTLINCTPANCESELLIATNKNKLIWVGNMASWRYIIENYECIGNGAQIAKGAMEMSNYYSNDPQERIIKSLEISNKFCTGVRPPFYIESIG